MSDNIESLNNRRHHDKYMPPHGMTMMRPGPGGVTQFFAADDEGNMRPVGHCLTIECGKFAQRFAFIVSIQILSTKI